MVKKKKYQITNKAYALLGIAIVSILLVLTQTTRDFTFEEGFNEIVKLDEKYGTSFKTEKLTTDLINYKNVDPFIEDLGKLREEVVNSIEKTYSKEKEALILFIDARALMILTQKSY